MKIRTRYYIFCLPVEKLFVPPRKYKRTPDLDFTPLLLHCLGVWTCACMHELIGADGLTPLTGFFKFFYRGCFQRPTHCLCAARWKEAAESFFWFSLYKCLCDHRCVCVSLLACQFVYAYIKICKQVTPEGHTDCLACLKDVLPVKQDAK